MKKWFVLLVVALLASWGGPLVSHAADQRPVLLVYDSTNAYYHGEKTIDSVQRMLTADGLAVKTVALSDYRPGELTDERYRGVITLINWQAANLTNAQFTADRAKFGGVKLHIGPNLQADELAGLHAKPGMLIRQQISLTVNRITEQLPYTERMEYLIGPDGEAYGRLNTQNVGKQTTLPYGVKVDRNAFLPFWRTSGLAINCEAQLLADLFNPQKAQPPLLVINNVTPTSNLKYLKRLVNDLDLNNIPFALSATNVETNTNQWAYRQYMYALRLAELKNGLVFMRVPYLYSYTGKEITAANLAATMNERLQLLVKSGVYPVGLAAPNHWNQDQVLGRVGLAAPTNVLLFPDPTTYPRVKTAAFSRRFARAYYVMSLQGLTKAKTSVALKHTTPTYALPVALNVKLPRTAAELRRAEKLILTAKVNWENPATQRKAQVMKFAKLTVRYQAGTYFMNGQEQTINAQAPTKPSVQHQAGQLSGLNLILAYQGKFLTGFIFVTLIGFGVLLYRGRQVYWDKFKRK